MMAVISYGPGPVPIASVIVLTSAVPACVNIAYAAAD
jgi:hypothetical protein